MANSRVYTYSFASINVCSYLNIKGEINGARVLHVYGN